MPFTFSHPALILPVTLLPKKTYSLTGLVVGSMAPDFEYFIRMKTSGHFGHTLPGILCFDLPMGLVMAFSYHLLVRDTLTDHLPGWFQTRIHAFKDFDWIQYMNRNWVIVMISILFGTATHLFWDSFTHERGIFVQIIPGMCQQINILGYNILLYSLLQYVSTVAGGIVILIAFYRLPKVNVPVNRNIYPYWLTLILISLIIIIIRIVLLSPDFHYHELIIYTISAGMLGLMLTPLLMKNRI